MITHPCSRKETLKSGISRINIPQQKPVSWVLWWVFACVRVCARACSISLLSSWPPYAELGAQAGSICQVNAQPRPQPQQLAPTSLIILGRIVQEHTAAHSRRTPTYVVTGCHSWERRGVSHNGKVIRAWEDIQKFITPELVWDECWLHEFIFLDIQQNNLGRFPSAVRWSGARTGEKATEVQE